MAHETDIVANPKTGSDRGRLRELDALRGIAAVGVVFYHLTYWTAAAALAPFHFAWGHYGVELFFIVSGFVIFMTLSQAATVGAFAASRFARLYPAYWSAVIVTVIAAIVFEQHPPSGANIIANLSMLQTFVGADNIDGSYWTLAVELEFYLAIALLFYFNLIGRIVEVLIGFLLVAHALRLAESWQLIPASPLLQINLLLYGAFFAIGICFYLLRSGQPRNKVLLVLALALLYAGWGTSQDAVPINPAIYAAVIAGLTLATWLALNAHLKLLRWPVLLWFGQISYPLYLVHQRIGADVALALHRHGVPGGLAIGLAILGLILLAWAINVWIETPARRRIRSALQRGVPAGRDTSGVS